MINKLKEIINLIEEFNDDYGYTDFGELNLNIDIQEDKQGNDIIVRYNDDAVSGVYDNHGNQII